MNRLPAGLFFWFGHGDDPRQDGSNLFRSEWAVVHGPGSRRSDRQIGCLVQSRSRCPTGVPRGRSRRGSPSKADSVLTLVAADSCHARLSLRCVPDRFEPGAMLAAVKDAARRASAVAKPSLTAAVRDVLGTSGREEETAPWQQRGGRSSLVKQEVVVTTHPKQRGSIKTGRTCRCYKDKGGRPVTAFPNSLQLQLSHGCKIR
jgi:hypothetical protein